MEWTEEVISRLQELWQQGLSTAEIGRQLNITKNAVVGKAHRLGLPARPSPIRKPAQASEAGDVNASAPVKKERRKAPSTRASMAKEKSGVVSDPVAPDTEAAAAETISEAPASPAARIDAILTSSQNKAAEPVAPRPTTPASAARISEPSASSDRPAATRVSPAVKPKAASSVGEEDDTDEQKPENISAAVVKQTLRSVLGDPSPRRGPSCCWPIGDPGTPGFHFCGAKPLPGKPYCAEHAALAYVKLRDRRDSVA